MPRDIREEIPETLPVPALRPASPSGVGRAAHHVLAFREVVANRFVGIPVAPCDWLRVVSVMPVIVIADGERIVPEPELIPTTTPTAADFAPDWEAGAAGLDAVHLRPSLAYTVAREVRTLSILGRISEGAVDYSDPVVLDLDQCWVPGTVHLFLGSGSVRDVGPGPYVDHVVSRTAVGLSGATSADLGPIRPTLHGDNAISGNGLRWVPTVTEILAANVEIQWSGAPGTLTIFALRQLCDGLNIRELRSYSLNEATPWLREWLHPIRIDTHTTRRNNAVDDRGALQVRLGTSAGMSIATAKLDCRSWL